MRATTAAVLFLLLAACGQAQPVASPATASPSERPSPPPELLFAVLEANGTANMWTYNTVAIAGLDGLARAKTTFIPMPVPELGCIGAILPRSAHVAASKVYFADGKGVVRSLAIDGKVATVATFPMTSTQQMLSFAVSPDGQQVLGTLFTTPKNAEPCDGSSSATNYAFDAYAASGGQPSRLVYHQAWTAPPANVLALTGWDATGPIGTYPTVWASQGGGPGSTLGVSIRIDPTTLKPAAPLSSSCQVWDTVASGDFVCLTEGQMTGGGTPQQSVSTTASIRRPDDSELWRLTLTSMNPASSPMLAPDAKHVVICCPDVDRPAFAEWMAGQDGSHSVLADGFTATGWLDSLTVVGEAHPDPLKQPPFPLAFVRLTDPTKFVSLGFTGLFVGTVSA